MVLAGPRLMSTIDFVEAREAGLAIGDEIVAVLQPGMDAQGRPRRVPAPSLAHRGGVGEDHQVFVAAPACGDDENVAHGAPTTRRALTARSRGHAEEVRPAATRED